MRMLGIGFKAIFLGLMTQMGPFLAEAKMFDRELVKSAPEAFDRFDMTPAMRAAARGDLAELKALLKAGHRLEAFNPNKAGVLYFAAQNQSHSRAIFEFVRKQVGPATYQNLLKQRVESNGHTVALEAVFNGNAQLVDYLLELRKTGIGVDFESPTVFGWTPKTFAEREKLSFASRLPEGSVATSERVAWIKSQEEDWNASLPPKMREFHARGMSLIEAIEKFDLPKVEALVASGVKLNERYGRLGATPLNSSVRPGMDAPSLELAKKLQSKLFDLGADPNFSESGIMKVSSGFRESVFGYADLLKHVIARFKPGSSERRSYLNVQGALNGYTKLIDASLRGKKDVIEVLVASGADKSIRGHNGMRAIDAARVYNQLSTEPLPSQVMKVLEP